MKFTTLISLFTLAQLALCANRGSYTVPGLGQRKQALLNAGGNTLDMAIAMLESDHMKADYVYGDGKSGDATNFGIFKQNWLMLRTSAGEFAGQSVEQVGNGAVLNHDLEKDVRARHDGEEHYGFYTWVAGHRNGASGLQNPSTDDIKTYKSAVRWIEQQIESDPRYQKDDTRFWVDVRAI